MGGGRTTSSPAFLIRGRALGLSKMRALLSEPHVYSSRHGSASFSPSMQQLSLNDPPPLDHPTPPASSTTTELARNEPFQAQHDIHRLSAANQCGLRRFYRKGLPPVPWDGNQKLWNPRSKIIIHPKSQKVERHGKNRGKLDGERGHIFAAPVQFSSVPRTPPRI